jgi:hypothetical protein
MLPTKAVRLALGTLLAADTTTLAPAVTANKISLIKAPFTPSENLVIGDLTLADFATSTAIAGTLGAQLVGTDPATLDQVITIKDPLGGYRWITTALTNLPQTIYGFALTDSTLATLLAVAVLPAPVTLQEVGQFIDLGSVQLTIVTRPIS